MRPKVSRVVHDRGDDVDSGDDRPILGNAIDGGVVARRKADEDVVTGGDRQPLEDGAQDPWSQLGRSTGGSGVPGQPDALVLGHRHLLRDQNVKWSSKTKKFSPSCTAHSNR